MDEGAMKKPTSEDFGSYHERKSDGSWCSINGDVFPTVRLDEGNAPYKTQRFVKNRIVRDLLDAASEGHKLDLNEIALRHAYHKYTRDELMELYRLIGYSVDGFCEIFYHEHDDNTDPEARHGPIEIVSSED